MLISASYTLGVSPLVSLQEVGVVLGKTRVFDGLDLTLHAGDRLGLEGPNGVGKTTLLRLLATLIHPTSGRIGILSWDGTGIAAPEVRRRIGYVAHAPSLNGELTLAENLRLFGRLGSSDVSPRDALEWVGLGRLSDRPAKLASQGMLRRADLARLLLGRPDVLLLDEPFAGLDRNAVGIVDAIVERTTRNGGCAIVVSHDAGHFTGFDRRLELTQHGTRDA